MGRPLCTECIYFCGATEQGMITTTLDNVVCIRPHQLVGVQINIKCVKEREDIPGACGLNGEYFEKKERK